MIILGVFLLEGGNPLATTHSNLATTFLKILLLFLRNKIHIKVDEQPPFENVSLVFPFSSIGAVSVWPSIFHLDLGISFFRKWCERLCLTAQSSS